MVNVPGIFLHLTQTRSCAIAAVDAVDSDIPLRRRYERRVINAIAIVDFRMQYYRSQLRLLTNKCQKCIATIAKSNGDHIQFSGSTAH